MSYEKSKNLHKQRYSVTVWCLSLYELKSGRKSMELMGRPDAPMTVLTKQSSLAQPRLSTILI